MLLLFLRCWPGGAACDNLARREVDGFALGVRGSGECGSGMLQLIARLVGIEVKEISVFRVRRLNVNLAVAFADHVLLGSFGRPPLRVAIKTLVVLEDD